MRERSATDAAAIDDWFLHRGLPLVLTRRVRAHALIERSAPLVGASAWRWPCCWCWQR